LKDLTDKPEFKDIVTKGFAAVGKEATLADVKAKIDANDACSDVFVTADGTRNTAAVGWITNIILARHSSA
jgi:hypothetical protein